jgi:hypothetical protein
MLVREVMLNSGADQAVVFKRRVEIKEMHFKCSIVSCILALAIPRLKTE